MQDPTIKWERIDVLRNPEQIAEKHVISASLIDTWHRETWQGGGYILRVPTNNILKTCSSDCGTYFVDGSKTREALFRERDVYGIAIPEAILQQTSPTKYNEIVLAGTGRDGQKVDITGIFVKVFPNGELVDETLARTLRGIAYSKSLPMIEILEPFHQYTEREPKVSPHSFNFVIGNELYLFQPKHSSFTVCSYGGKKSRPMRPEERAQMIAGVRQYLATTPNTELEAMVEAAEKVPDHLLRERVEQHYRQKNKDGMFGSEGFMKILQGPAPDIYDFKNSKDIKIK